VPGSPVGWRDRWHALKFPLDGAPAAGLRGTDARTSGPLTAKGGTSHPVPLRYQLLEALRREIARGAFLPGHQLPTEKRLMAAYRVSRHTVREAIRDLINEGLARIERGRGTFVAPPRIEQELTSLTGFVEDMLSLGLRPDARVLEVAQVKASAAVAAKLGLQEHDPVFRIERIRLADGQPISFDLTFLPAALGEKIAREDLRLYPIFSLLEDQVGIVLDRAEYYLEARAADRKVARALEIARGAPMLVIERTVFDADRRPVDYELLHYRGDRLRYLVRLNRKRPDFRLWELGNKLELFPRPGASAAADAVRGRVPSRRGAARPGTGRDAARRGASRP
jgi:GntR family transcriptional regulator